MKNQFPSAVIALLAGSLFGLGLGVSGMINPAKVLNFLDLAGQWDPTLAFVMGGAVLVSFPAFHVAKRGTRRPLLSDGFHLPNRNDIDSRLLGGAAIFGIGWGLGGFCPGPAIAAISSLQLPVVGFILAMVLGQWLADLCSSELNAG
jgi:uncharacterized membrane protein YedE/YeeE